MRISLIDVDSKIPNLALMKISAYHKLKGDTVGFNLKNPDKIYSSIVFTKNKYRAFNKSIDKVEHIFGGSGYDVNVKLCNGIEYIKPDYDLYPSTYSQGFTTRGCIRNCYFCIVRSKEGRLIRHQHPKEFVDDRFDTVMIMDNNWLADRDWFFETSDWLIEKGLKVLEHGLDIRLIDRLVIDQLKDMNIPIIHFAFDDMSYKNSVIRGLDLLEECGINLRNNVSFYVYCHDDNMYIDALERINLLRSFGTNAFIMWNCESKKSDRIKDLIHWCNRKWLYWKIPFSEYIT